MVIQPVWQRGGVVSIHRHFVRGPSISRRSKQSGCECQPWFYLRLAAYSFFWLSEGA